MFAAFCASPSRAEVNISALLSSSMDPASVKFADKIRIPGDCTELLLNGVGVRGVSIYRGYKMALYLSEKQTDARAAIEQKGAKRIEIVPLIDVPAAEWAKALGRGIEKNHTGAEMDSLRSRVETFKTALLALKTTPKKTILRIDYLPESGTWLRVNGKNQGEPVKGEDFFRAVLKIWIGDKPTQKDLKQALLGQVMPGQPRPVFTQ